MKGRVLQYWVTFQECGGDINKALELACLLKPSRVLCIERREDLDLFSIWYLLGGE